MERITADVIAEKEFTIESRGYNKDEVDTFLDLICEELDRLNNEIQDLRQKTTIVRTAAPAAEASGASRENEERFLDDWTVSQVSQEIGMPVRIVRQSGEDFVRALYGLI